MDGLVGELAALGTACCWAMTAMFFAAAGARVGSLPVNFIRLVMAFAMLCVFGALVRGHALPLDASPRAWAYLSISGLIGFTIGDLALFRAFLLIGPRLSSLIMSMAPPMAAIIGWLVLGETLVPLDWLGMTMTVGGIAWAITDRTPSTAGVVTTSARERSIGVSLAFVGAVGQAGGLVISKLGMGDYDAFAATQIRIVAGSLGFAVIFFATGWWPRVRQAIRHRSAMGYTALGAVFGPFLGVSLSLLAVQHTKTGVAASIMATSPILIIPAVVVFRGERVGPGGWLGTLLAVGGVAVLFA